MNKYYEFLELAHIECKKDEEQEKPFHMSLLEVMDSINDEDLLNSYHLSVNQNSLIHACKELQLPPLKVKILLFSASHYDRHEVEITAAYKISQDRETIELFKPSDKENSETHPFKFDPDLDENKIPIRIYDLNDFIKNFDEISFTNHWATIALVDEQGNCLICE